uniref:AAA+ ATPase domain-containing protein n=1 Tax=Panagrolaimus superbus TaxID=310955 RepID=A0A914YUS0_9BILA
MTTMNLATHIVSRIDCGIIVWIRIIPDNEEIQIGSIYETFKNGEKLNPMLEANCKIETLTNWNDLKQHNSVKDAIEFAEKQMNQKKLCQIRYVLNRLTSNALWQHDDNAVIAALKNLIRLETSKNAIIKMLENMNVKPSKDLQISSLFPTNLDEKLINDIRNNHKFFNFKLLKQHEFIPAVINIYTEICRLQLLCFEYMRKRYLAIAMPGRPYINHILDMSLLLYNFGNDIHKIVDENFLQQRKGIFYFNLCTTKEEESLTISNFNFLLIIEERNLDAILGHYLKWQKYEFLIGFLNGPPKTRFLAKTILHKDEKVFLHINSNFKCLGIAVPPNNNIRAVLPNSTDLFMAKCQCGSDEMRAWICGDCNELLYYSSGRKTCCKCGKEDFHKMSIKCFNEYHGSEYFCGRENYKLAGILPSMCLPTSAFSTKKNYLNFKNTQNEDSYEPAEKLNVSNKNKSVAINLPVPVPSTSTPTPTPAPAPAPTLNGEVNDIKTNDLSTNPSVKTDNSENIKKPATPDSVTHSYNLRSSKNHTVADNGNNDIVNEHFKIRSIISNDKTAFMKTKENPSQNPTEVSAKDKTEIKSHISQIPQEMSSKTPNKEVNKKINIVIIGESGVGKSTLLNAIANYLKFETAEMALKNDLEYIIPCQFKVFYDDFSERLVSIGNSDKNEQYQFETSESTALSTTQECKEHSFEFKGYKINFIDTPGLSDTLGIEKDERNLEKIRSFICGMDSLHAICFVVKANEARMDIAFSKAMNDLLSIFPKSALSKIIFFMTHSRGTLYGPGDTMAPLTKISKNLATAKGQSFSLSSANIFCVDNEAFLYLCAKHCGIEYSGASLADFENSWKKSKQATQRFFDNVITLKSVNIKNIKFLKDLENVLKEQKMILSTRATPERWFHHFLTAKTMDFIEIGNIGQKYLNLIDMVLIEKEATSNLKGINLKNLNIKEAVGGISGFLKTRKTTSMPESQKFVENYLSASKNI